MVFVSTEESAQGQGPQEPDSVQHANAPQERQAKGEVRHCQEMSYFIRFYVKRFILCAPQKHKITSAHSVMLSRLQFDLKFLSFQGSYATAEEVPKAVRCPSKVGPEIPGIAQFT